MVDGARLVTDFVADLEQLFRSQDADALTLAEAADVSGFSLDHIGRLVRQGKIPNIGEKHRPRIRRGDLPRKPGPLPIESEPVIVHRTSKRQIARSVVNPSSGRRDG
jgi:hypothetical protein